jgi:TDG/mug DNA glycosylase family protein
MMPPTPQQLRAAAHQQVPDVIAPGLRVLFCGINPGLYSAALGQHFARPGNRFWAALHAAGFTPRRLTPDEQHELLALGLGLTNLVPRATARADELSTDELIAGLKRLKNKVKRYQPGVLAVLGLGAYRLAWRQPAAQPGLQNQAWGKTQIWVLPNPSGLNAHYSPADLSARLRELHDFVHQPSR